jgi:hypothetical protein
MAQLDDTDPYAYNRYMYEIHTSLDAENIHSVSAPTHQNLRNKEKQIGASYCGSPTRNKEKQIGASNPQNPDSNLRFSLATYSS